MTAVVIALLPAAGFGIYNFGPRALAVMAVTIASTVLTELLFGWLWKKKITITDMSAVVTGLLLALNLPVSIPLWIAALGGVFAILVVKMLFGGLGQNFMNPALAARCFLLISFPSQMTNFVCDAYTGATPLAALKAGESVNVMNMIVGKTAGTIGGLLGICGRLCLSCTGNHRQHHQCREDQCKNLLHFWFSSLSFYTNNVLFFAVCYYKVPYFSHSDNAEICCKHGQFCWTFFAASATLYKKQISKPNAAGGGR